MRFAAGALSALVAAGCGTQEWAFSDTTSGRADAAASAAAIDATAADAVDDAALDATNGADTTNVPDASVVVIQLRCTDDSLCAPFGLHCDLGSGKCVGCVRDSQCPSGKPHCDRTISRCVRCLDDADCPQGQTCASSTHTCGNSSPSSNPPRDQ